MSTTEPLWTLAELTARVALALAEGYPGSPNGRVREVPDPRTIRYYTTLGLIDRPAEMRGRTALYGLHHLQQLVAIKRLQAHGLSLAEIQQRLLGLSAAALARIARVAGDVAKSPEPTPALPDGQRHDSFWRTPPADPHPTRETTAASADDSAADLRPLQGIPLGPAVALLFAPARPLDDNDVEVLRQAAAPLLKLLRKRRLLGPHDERNHS
jgi:DNA-binding transcriptional MerR regulator